MGKVAEAFMKKRKQKLYTPPVADVNDLAGQKPVTTVMIPSPADADVAVTPSNDTLKKKSKIKPAPKSRY